jgi:hypothetical protein
MGRRSIAEYMLAISKEADAATEPGQTRVGRARALPASCSAT